MYIYRGWVFLSRVLLNAKHLYSKPTIKRLDLRRFFVLAAPIKRTDKPERLKQKEVEVDID